MSPGSTTWREASKVASGRIAGDRPRAMHSTISAPSTTIPRSALAARMASGSLIHRRMRGRTPFRFEAREWGRIGDPRRNVKPRRRASRPLAAATIHKIGFDVRNFGPYGDSPWGARATYLRRVGWKPGAVRSGGRRTGSVASGTGWLEEIRMRVAIMAALAGAVGFAGPAFALHNA